MEGHIVLFGRIELISIQVLQETKTHKDTSLFTLPDPDSDPYSDSDSYTMQKFHIGSDSDSDPQIEMYVVGTEICP